MKIQQIIATTAIFLSFLASSGYSTPNYNNLPNRGQGLHEPPSRSLAPINKPVVSSKPAEEKLYLQTGPETGSTVQERVMTPETDASNFSKP